MNQSSTIAVVESRYACSTDYTLTLDLAGPICLRDRDGADLTPRARKAQGLLALIATSPNLRRSRTWLQDKLWSDREPEQGAASLRQCLTGIRSGLGKHVGCLKAEAGWVALDRDRVRVRTDLVRPDLGGEVEFLEGIDIRDPEFENWLRDQRRYHSEHSGWSADRVFGDAGIAKQTRTAYGRHGIAVSAATRATIGLAMHHAPRPDNAEDSVSEFVLELVARPLLGDSAVDVIDFRMPRDEDAQPVSFAGCDWLLQAASSVLKERVRVALRLLKLGDKRLLWTDAGTFDLAEFYEPEQLAVGAFTSRAARSVLERIARPRCQK
jgi:hypothetical protein